MMRVVFYDSRRETYLPVGDVIQIEGCCSKINGRFTNVWLLTLRDGTTRTFPQRHYKIHRVEI